MATDRKSRTLEIFYRGIRGEDLSPSKLAAAFGVATKTVHRSFKEIDTFLTDNRELVGYTELKYSRADKVYRIYLDDFLSDKELFAVAKVIIGARAFSESEISQIIGKLKHFASVGDREKLDEIIRKELYHYSPIRHDCESIIDNLWQFIGAIADKKELTISYYRKDRTYNERRIQPVALMFSEFYFYLIAYYPGEYDEPRYFRVDRIVRMVQHRKSFINGDIPDYNDSDNRKRAEQVPPSFDEGELRKRNQYMFFGKLRQIRFWYTGPSLQAILDKLPTAKIIERDRGRNKYLLEAEVYGDGIKMFLLSQGSMVQVVSPDEFVEEMRVEIENMRGMYGDNN